MEQQNSERDIFNKGYLGEYFSSLSWKENQIYSEGVKARENDRKNTVSVWGSFFQLTNSVSLDSITYQNTPAPLILLFPALGTFLLSVSFLTGAKIMEATLLTGLVYFCGLAYRSMLKKSAQKRGEDTIKSAELDPRGYTLLVPVFIICLAINFFWGFTYLTTGIIAALIYIPILFLRSKHKRKVSWYKVALVPSAFVFLYLSYYDFIGVILPVVVIINLSILFLKSLKI